MAGCEKAFNPIKAPKRLPANLFTRRGSVDEFRTSDINPDVAGIGMQLEKHQIAGLNIPQRHLVGLRQLLERPSGRLEAHPPMGKENQPAAVKAVFRRFPAEAIGFPELGFGLPYDKISIRIPGCLKRLGRVQVDLGRMRSTSITVWPDRSVNRASGQEKQEDDSPAIRRPDAEQISRFA